MRDQNNTSLAGPELSMILDRIASFFMAAGVSTEAFQRQVASALARAARRRPSMQFVAQSDFLSLERIVDHWLRSPEYVNTVGRPRPLPFAGAHSICSIIRETQIGGDARSAVAALTKLGAVARNPDATYSLTARYCNWQASGTVAYEPQAAFLMNAVMAATHATSGPVEGHELFWRSSVSELVPATLAKKYLQFARTHGTRLLAELDDWLSQHEVRQASGSKKQRYKRIGVGFFPFIQPHGVGKNAVKARKRTAVKRPVAERRKSSRRSALRKG